MYVNAVRDKKKKKTRTGEVIYEAKKIKVRQKKSKDEGRKYVKKKEAAENRRLEKRHDGKIRNRGRRMTGERKMTEKDRK